MIVATAPSSSIPDDAGTQSLLASIVVNAPIPIFFKDLDGVYVFINDAYLAQGDNHSRERLIGHTDVEVYPGPIAIANREDDMTVVDSGGSIRRTRPFKVGGEERKFDTVKFPVLSDGGDVIGVCGVAIDITDTLNEQDVREVERKRDIAAKPFERLFSTLTPQEARIAGLLALGYSDKEIAENLSLTADTVRHHVSHILKKLRKHSRTQAVIEMLRHRKRP